MTYQAERSLQAEVMLRLRAYPVVAVPVPNSTHFPTRTPAERSMAGRIVNQMKAGGMLLPGAADIVVMGRSAGGFIELKRPAEKTLLRKIPKGQLSDDQKEFRDRCARIGVNWAVCTSWAEVEAALTEWGVLNNG